jgi:type IV pilus assembly protein PilO
MNNFAVVTILLLLVAVGAGVFFWMNYYQPILDEAESLKSDIDDLEKKKARLANIDDEIDKIRQDIAKLQDQRKGLETESNRLETVVPKVLESTETIANKFDVKFQDIRISPLVRAEDWSELPIEISVQGTFKNIGEFLTIVEKRKIINLAAGSMNVSVSAEVDRKTKSPLLGVTLSAKVYILGGN